MSVVSTVGVVVTLSVTTAATVVNDGDDDGELDDVIADGDDMGVLETEIEGEVFSTTEDDGLEPLVDDKDAVELGDVVLHSEAEFEGLAPAVNEDVGVEDTEFESD